jgi:hypothetical protein
MLAADHVRELTQHHVTRERIDRFVPIPNITEPPFHIPAWTRIRGTHETSHEPLLDQLEQATQQATAAGAWGGGSAASKPAARLDAIAVLQRIDRQSLRLAADIGLPLGRDEKADLAKRLLAISGRVGAQEHPTVKAWWVAARCTTGWEQAPYSPDVPCPNVACERWSSLRVRLDEYLASCVECGETWDEHNYTHLGEYVTWASEHLHGPRHWKYDAEGYPVECTECLDEREAMADRAAARHAAERAQRGAA